MIDTIMKVRPPKQVYGMPKDAVDLVIDDEEGKKKGEPASNVYVIEGKVEHRPGYLYNQFFGQYVHISPAELALQE